MITVKDYGHVFTHLKRAVPAIKIWYEEYLSTPQFYKVSGQIVKSSELYLYLFVGDLAKLEVPDNFPQAIHNKAVEAIRQVDVKAVLLKIKLGV